MKVILNSDMENLGKAGDVVDVKEGHARNFLIPQLDPAFDEGL